MDQMLSTDFKYRPSALDNQFVYILDGIEAAKIVGQIVTWSRILDHWD